MIESFLVAFQTLLIGVVATLILDAWLLLLTKFGFGKLNFRLIGRWVGYGLKGQWTHDAIGKTPSLAGEVLLGWISHYAVGMAFAVMLVGLLGPAWLRLPSFAPAILFGATTVVAPLFIMQPAMGAGFAFSNSPNPLSNCLRSCANHTVFGSGLYLAALAVSGLA